MGIEAAGMRDFEASGRWVLRPRENGF